MQLDRGKIDRDIDTNSLGQGDREGEIQKEREGVREGGRVRHRYRFLWWFSCSHVQMKRHFACIDFSDWVVSLQIVVKCRYLAKDLTFQRC